MFYKYFSLLRFFVPHKPFFKFEIIATIEISIVEIMGLAFSRHEFQKLLKSAAPNGDYQLQAIAIRAVTFVTGRRKFMKAASRSANCTDL